MKGYTLIELIIYIAVLGLMAVAFGSLAISISGSAGRASGSADLEESLHMALEQLSDAFITANQVSYPAAGASDTYLALTHAETSEIISFGISGGVLQRGSNGTSSSTISDANISIESLTFTHRNSGGRRDHVGVSIVGSTNTGGGTGLTIPIHTSFVTGQ